MANSQSGFGARLGGVLLGACLAMTGTVLVVAPAVAAEKKADKKDEKKPELSPKVLEKLKPAGEALNKGDAEKGIALSKEALDLAKTDYDKLQSLLYLRNGYGRLKDIPNYVATTEQLVALDNFPAEERGKMAKVRRLRPRHFEIDLSTCRKLGRTGRGLAAHRHDSR